jgi:putative peptidoglycan lipid II flippase
LFGFLIFATLVVLGKISSLIRDAYISYSFGAGSDTDAYFVAVSIPSVVLLAFYSTISLALLPIYADVRHKETKERSDTFISYIINVYFLIALLIGILTFIFSARLVGILSPELATPVKVTASELLKIVSFSFSVSTLCAIFATIQYAHRGRFGLLISPVVNNLIVLPIVFLFAPRYGIYSAAAAATLGWIVQAPVQYFLAAKHFSYRLWSGLSNVYARKLALISLPIFIGLLVDQVNVVINLYFAGGLPEGAISAINYASRLAQLPSGIFVLVISIIVYPIVTDFVAKGDMEQFDDVVMSTAKILPIVCIPVMIVLYLYKETFVAWIFMRGSFDEQAARNTASLFGIYGFGTLLMTLREFLNRVFLSLKIGRAPLIISVVIVLANALLCLVLVEPFGARGLAAGTTIALLVGVVLQFYLIARHMSLGRLLAPRFVVGLVAANGIPAALLIWGFSIDQSRVQPIMDVAVQLLVAGAIFAIITAIVHRNEIDGLLTAMKKRGQINAQEEGLGEQV